MSNLNDAALPPEAERLCRRHLKTAIRAMERAAQAARQHDAEATIYLSPDGLHVLRGGINPERSDSWCEAAIHLSVPQSICDAGDW